MNGDELIAGYTAYTDAATFGASAAGEAPAITPVTITTVSSPECIIFTISVVGGTVTSIVGTNSAGC